MFLNAAPSCIVTTLSLWLVLAVPCHATAPAQAERGADPDRYVSGQIVVRFAPGISPTERMAGLDAAGAELTRDVRSRDAEVAFTRATLKPGSELADVLAALRDDPRVQLAEPNGLWSGDAPNDPWCVDDPTPLSNTNYDQWGYYRVNADLAWDNRPPAMDLQLVTVAILDTGLDLDHPDAPVTICAGGGCLHPNWLEQFGTPGVDDDGNGYIDDVFGIDFVRSEQGMGDVAGYDGNADVFAADPDGSCGNGLDDDGDGSADEGVYHGTHVTGIIATWTNNAQAFAGAAWYAELLPIRVLSPEGWGSWADIAEGIIYAADNGAHVINLSLGGGYSAVVDAAVQYAHSQGCVLVAAAGNDGIASVHYPAALDEVIAVGGTDPDDTRWQWSNWGPEIDVVAPAVKIFSNAVTSVANAGGSFPVGSPDYYWANGTSQATPFVTALAANIFSECGPPPGGLLTNEEVRLQIRSQATPLPGTWDGAGLVSFLGIVCSTTSDAPVAVGPSGLGLAAGRPNPFRDGVSLRFSVDRRAAVSVSVYDAGGRQVRRLWEGAVPAGEHLAEWDGRDEQGTRAAAGVYFVRLLEQGAADSNARIRKVTLLR